jgi:hypothetical protein
MADLTLASCSHRQHINEQRLGSVAQHAVCVRAEQAAIDANVARVRVLELSLGHALT